MFPARRQPPHPSPWPCLFLIIILKLGNFIKGYKGKKGITGDVGRQGEDGKQGRRGYPGVLGPKGRVVSILI